MPIGRLVSDTVRAAELQAKLVTEWTLPSENLFESSPVLIEDEKPVKGRVTYQPLHIYAIWSEWDDLSQMERSEILMDAYTETHPIQDVLRVTVAMGLTPAEAQRMGINYKTK